MLESRIIFDCLEIPKEFHVCRVRRVVPSENGSPVVIGGKIKGGGVEKFGIVDILD